MEGSQRVPAEVLAKHWLGLKKNSKTPVGLVGVPNEIRTGRVSNTSTEVYYYVSLLGITKMKSHVARNLLFN